MKIVAFSVFDIAENIDNSVDSMTATVSGKWKSDLFCLLS